MLTGFSTCISDIKRAGCVCENVEAHLMWHVACFQHVKSSRDIIFLQAK